MLPNFAPNINSNEDERPERVDSPLGSLGSQDPTPTESVYPSMSHPLAHDSQTIPSFVDENESGNLSPKPRCDVCKDMYDPSSLTARRCICRGTSPTTTLSSVGDSLRSSVGDSLRSTDSVSDSLKSTGSVSSNENGTSQIRISGEYSWLAPSAQCQPAGNHCTSLTTDS